MICDYPIHFDTYRGCSHKCEYCFTSQIKAKKEIRPLKATKAIKNFINGRRESDTAWCDWDIPIKWGGTSDPFQACEKEYGISLAYLRLFAETKYPFIVSTKNPVLAAGEPYLSLLSQCNCVFQISMACSEYDKLETGAPTYEERLKAAKILSQHVTRLIVRVQPFFPKYFEEILKQIPCYAQSGAYGVIVEGYYDTRKHEDMQRDGKKYDFPLDVLVPMFKQIREECHKYGLRFFSGEDRIRFLGDDLSCCGTEGLDEFKPNKFNIQHLAFDENCEPTQRMKQQGGVYCFKSTNQCTEYWHRIKDKTFEELMHDIGDNHVKWYKELKERYGE